MKVLVARRPLSRGWFYAGVGLIALFVLYFYKLGTLTAGMSPTELKTAETPIGWHGIYHQPFFLPLQALRSAIFLLRPGHGATLTRLASVAFGLMAVLSFYLLIRWWYGSRTAFLATLLFACSAWVLHINRFAGFDVMYLWFMCTLLLVQAALHKLAHRPLVYVSSISFILVALYIPGAFWFALPLLYLERRVLRLGWQRLSIPWRSLTILLPLLFLPLLVLNLERPDRWRTWVGLPQPLPQLHTYLHHLAAVPYHLFARGPLYPELWLGRAPILDIFCLIICLLGMYFLARNWSAFRSRLLGFYLGGGMLLVALGGPVALSLLVPLLYVFIATGLAFVSRSWVRTFPTNPLARNFGILILCGAVALSCLYNLRAYFVAWPHNTTAKTVFRYHR